MSIQKKLSPGTAHLMAALRLRVDAELDGAPMRGDMEITMDNDQVSTMLEGYRTTTAVGERGVTLDDMEAVGNLRRDLQNATRTYAGDVGFDYMTEHTDADSFRLTLSTQDNALSIQSAFYRPGREEQGNTNFISITDQWAGDDEDKAIEAHLKSLTKKLAAGKQ